MDDFMSPGEFLLIIIVVGIIILFVTADTINSSLKLSNQLDKETLDDVCKDLTGDETVEAKVINGELKCQFTTLSFSEEDRK